MKLASYRVDGRSRFGVVRGEGIVDLTARVGDQFVDLRTLLGGDALQKAERLTRRASADYSIAEVAFEPVIPNPDKIICVGINYEAHRAETKRERTAKPPLFLRLSQSQVGHLQPLIRPPESTMFDYEGEIAVVIGKPGRRISPAQAPHHIAGYSCYNDGSVRDWQAHTHQWTPGKNFDATAAFGPWLVTASDDHGDAAMTLTTRVNGQMLQSASTEMMIFSIPELISYVSTFTTLRPGDVIVTGTPGGVGSKRSPPIYLQPGDVVEVEVDRVGTLRNQVA